MADIEFGANQFDFTGDRTQVTFFPQAPGPARVGDGPHSSLVRYDGIEGSFEFRGGDVTLTPSALGMLVSVPLKRPDDAGGIALTILVPDVHGVTHKNAVTFETLGIKATSPGGFTPPEGADLTYTIVPFLTTAQLVFLTDVAASPQAAGANR